MLTDSFWFIFWYCYSSHLPLFLQSENVVASLYPQVSTESRWEIWKTSLNFPSEKHCARLVIYWKAKPFAADALVTTSGVLRNLESFVALTCSVFLERWVHEVCFYVQFYSINSKIAIWKTCHYESKQSNNHFVQKHWKPATVTISVAHLAELRSE